MFDYFHVTEVWIKYWWRDKTMAWYRYNFCDPSETYETLCAVPIYADPDDETVRTTQHWTTTSKLFGMWNHHHLWAISHFLLVGFYKIGMVSSELQLNSVYVDSSQRTNRSGSVLIHFLLGNIGMDDNIYFIGTFNISCWKLQHEFHCEHHDLTILCAAWSSSWSWKHWKVSLPLR